MESEASLLALPEYLVRYQLLPFLTERDLSHLDAACCSRASRAAYHLILRGKVVNNAKIITLHGTTYEWMSKRQCYFAHVAIGRSTQLDQRS